MRSKKNPVNPVKNPGMGWGDHTHPLRHSACAASHLITEISGSDIFFNIQYRMFNFEFPSYHDEG